MSLSCVASRAAALLRPGAPSAVAASPYTLRLGGAVFARAYATPVQKAFRAEEKAAPSGDFPTLKQQATGQQRAELAGENLGDQEAVTGPFGTKEAPVQIESAYPTRIVGCNGGLGEKAHLTSWFQLEFNKLTSCPDCGQVFELVAPKED